jgi:hypothetical protein
MAISLSNLIKATKQPNTIITPKLNEWLMVHGDEAIPPEIMEILIPLMTTPPRERSKSFSSSSAGFCHRRQVLGYLGIQTIGAIDPQLQNIFNDGKWRHLRWQAMLLQAGLLDDVEFPLVWKKMRSRGTMDGHGVVGDDHPRNDWRGKEYGFELKGVSAWQFPRLKKDDEIKEDHLNQVNRYFLMSGLDLFIILYEDKSTQAWWEWVIEPDEQIMEEQREELEILNQSVDDKVLPPVLPSCRARTGPQFKECPYGGSAGSPCIAAGKWPRIKKG